MEEKYDEKKEKQLRLLAENRLEPGHYKIFDYSAHVITRKNIEGKNCLVVINGEGETIIITPEFEMVLFNALKNWSFIM